MFLALLNSFKEIDNIIKIDTDGVVYNNNKPYFLHGPGSTYLDNTLEKMGNKPKTKISDQLSKDKYWNMIYNIYADFLFFLAVLSVVALVVFIILKLTKTI